MYDLGRIRATVSMRDVLGRYGIRVDRGGKAACPFHHDRHPSMKIYPGDRGYYCFVCHEGGDVLRFIQRMENCSFGEAARIAAEMGGIEDGRETAEMRDRRNRQRERERIEQRCGELRSQWRKAVERAHMLTDLAAQCTTWTETLAGILKEREDMLRLADLIDERLNEYERTAT